LIRCRDGLPLDGRRLTSDVVREWREEIGGAPATLAALQQTAREMRLVRTFRGRLLAMKAAVPLADDPVKLWDVLATSYPTLGRDSHHANTLFLMSIADGSIDADYGRRGLARVVHTYNALRTVTDEFERHWPETAGWGVARLDTDVADIRPLVQPLVLGLEPLGLAPVAPGGWDVTPMLKTFAHAAISMTPATTRSTPSL
jgi:hypothetical protein